MSAVGFRCISETRKSPTEPLRFKVRYFANSSLGNIEGDDEIGLKDVLGVLAYDALRDAVKQMFEELRALIKAACLKGLTITVVDFELQFDFIEGWQIAVKSLINDETLTFKSVAQFQSFLVETFKIEPLPGVSEVDARAATNLGL